MISAGALAVALILGAPVQTNIIDSARLEELRVAAAKAHSSSLLVMQSGAIVGEWYFDGGARPIETQSVTKSVLALLVGAKVGSAELPTIDAHVADFYPEWRQGQKALVTVRHLLTHTSCLQDTESSADEIAAAPDAVQLALAAELSCTPGSRFRYSNKATNLLVGIVGKVYKKPVDEAAKEVLFAPLDIEDYRWMKDSAGNPYGMGGLMLKAVDMAKIGLLVANKGRRNNAQVIPEGWIDTMCDVGPTRDYGLLWWRREPSLVERVRGLRHTAIVARGWLGQYIFVAPKQDYVVVRQYDITRGTTDPVAPFPRFEELAARLVSSKM